MPVQLQIRGAEELHRTAARLKQVEGGKQVLREMTRSLRTTAKPALQDAQRAARGLHSAGVRGGGGQQRREFTEGRARKLTEATKRRAFRGRGLRTTTAGALRTVVKTGGRSAVVRIEVNLARMPRDQRTLPGYMDTGKWRHPVMGNRNVWVAQTATPPGWFSTTVPRHGPRMRDQAYDVIDDINRRVIS